jgi:hypothetical protein
MMAYVKKPAPAPRRCADEYCRKEFRPRVARQVYCCDACQRSAANRRWYRKYAERVRGQHKAYRDANKARIGEYFSRWSAANRERINGARRKEQ